MKKFFSIRFKLPFIILMFMALMFAGVSSVMAFTGTMIVNQGGICTDVERLHQNTALSTVNYLEETRPFPNTNISRTALATPQPEPTFHVGKSISLYDLS